MRNVLVGLTIGLILLFSLLALIIAIADFSTGEWFFPLGIALVCGFFFILEMRFLFDDEEFEEPTPKPTTKEKTKHEEKIIVLKDTRCPACGARLENSDACSYCGTKTILYKKII